MLSSEVTFYFALPALSVSCCIMTTEKRKQTPLSCIPEWKALFQLLEINLLNRYLISPLPKVERYAMRHYFKFISKEQKKQCLLKVNARTHGTNMCKSCFLPLSFTPPSSLTDHIFSLGFPFSSPTLSCKLQL